MIHTLSIRTGSHIELVDITNKVQEVVRAGGVAEGNSPAHIKASLMGPNLTVLVTGGSLLLGTWQGVYLCEFDGPRTRKVHIKIMAG